MNGLDGSDGPQRQPAPPRAYQNFKELLYTALLAFETLDDASLAMLQHDVDYRNGVQRLISPHRERDASALSGTPRRLFQALPSAPLKAKKNLRKVLKQNQGTVEAVWLHLISGSWNNGFNVDHLAGQLNAELQILHPADDSSSATPAERELRAQPQSTKAEAVVDAWMTKDRLAVAIAFRAQIHGRREVLQAFDALSDLVVDRSALVLTRTHGINFPGFRLRSPDDDPFAIDYLIRAHKAAVLKQTKEYLIRKWGKKLKMGDMRPLVDLTSTDEYHLCFFIACRGPFALMQRFVAAPPDVFPVVVEIRNSPFTLQVQTYEVLIDGFLYMDSYKFL